MRSASRVVAGRPRASAAVSPGWYFAYCSAASIPCPLAHSPSTSAEALARAEALEQRLTLLEKGTPLDRLPNADRAIVDKSKFEDYSMDEANPRNRGKAQAWRDVGYNIDTAN